MPPQDRRPGPSLPRRGRSPGAPAVRSAVVPLPVMKLALVVHADLGLGRGKIAAQAAHAAVVFALADLGTPDFLAWLRDGSLWPRRAAVARNRPPRKPNGSRVVSPVSLVLSNCGCDGGRYKI